MGDVLLVGNGPNYYTNGPGWSDAIRCVAKAVGHPSDSVDGIIDQPLPLVFETLVAGNQRQEQNAKAELATALESLQSNQIHRQLMGLGWPHVLTTNYDYCLEKSLGVSFARAVAPPESTYSMFRRRCYSGRSVWHIHGEISGPRTVMLGSHQYAGYLQKIRSRLTTMSRSGRPVWVSAVEQESEEVPLSWVDLFVTGNVHIFGLGLDYSEIVLWWLICYKLRMRGSRFGSYVGSTTFYNSRRARPKMLKILGALGVIVKNMPTAEDYPTLDQWQDFIEDFHGDFRSNS